MMEENEIHLMFLPQGFIRTDEEWVIWLLAEEFHQTSNPEMIVERTHLTPEQVDQAVRNLERIKAIRTVRIRGIVQSFFLSDYGKEIYCELKEREKETEESPS
jgi:hypothetical protein